MKRHLILSLIATTLLFGEDQPADQPQKTESAAFKPFTGRIVGTKVRMRVKPELNAPVAKELKFGDLFVILGETDDFYSVSPPEGTKLYIHRKFILDNAVEGTRVNVRLEPTTDAPVIAQLSGGERVSGSISEKNNKWFEIVPPATARFFIAKDYVENVGSPALYNELASKRNAIERALTEAKEAIQEEMQKPYDAIHIDEALQKLTAISKETRVAPREAEEARQLLAKTHDSYLQKKIGHLETEADRSATLWVHKNQQLQQEIADQAESVRSLEARVKGEELKKPMMIPIKQTVAMLAWEPAEEALYESWKEKQESPKTIDEYYADQEEQGITLQGTVAPYNQSLSTRPGDYLLMSQSTGTPVAYLYSTKVNLSEYVGRPLTLRASERPNNHYAFPAYFVFSLEEK